MEYNTTVLDIVYDEAGQPFSIRYKGKPTATGTLYYYVLNVQGDVVGLLNAAGELVVEYEYDPWGKLLNTKIGVDEAHAKYEAYNNMGLRNPLRYRGYIYDRDTGLYYLQSRYYDPAIGRFINADAFASTDTKDILGSNMFVYCENNPINNHDSSGDFCLASAIVGGVLNAGLAVAGAYMDAFISGESVNTKDMIVDTVVAFASGLIQGGTALKTVSMAVDIFNVGWTFGTTVARGGTLEEAVYRSAVTYVGAKAGLAIGKEFSNSAVDSVAGEISGAIAQGVINGVEDTGDFVVGSVNNRPGKTRSTRSQKTTTHKVHIHALCAS